MIRFMNCFTKITAFPLYSVLFRTKIYYEDKKEKKRNIKGPAIIVCNHTHLFDYAILLFTFFTRTIRCQMAEVLFHKGALTVLLRALGGIFVDRDSKNFSFVPESLKILYKGGVVAIFPESRLPRKGEERPLEFKTSAVYIALKSGAPIIPVYTNGAYFTKKRARVIIGRTFSASEMYREELSEKENLIHITGALRQKIIALGEEMRRQQDRK